MPRSKEEEEQREDGYRKRREGVFHGGMSSKGKHTLAHTYVA